jgi:cytochrome c oxidase assembly factor CtaG
MTAQSMPPPAQHPSTGSERVGVPHVPAWILGCLALLAAALGGWMALAAEDATMTVTIPFLIEGNWAATEVREFWAPVLLIGGGLVAAVLFGLAGIAGFRARAGRLLPSIAALLAVVGIAAIVAGVVVLL